MALAVALMEFKKYQDRVFLTHIDDGHMNSTVLSTVHCLNLLSTRTQNEARVLLNKRKKVGSSNITPKREHLLNIKTSDIVTQKNMIGILPTT